MTEETVIDEPSPELLAEAREMGWRPKEEFKGDEVKWVDAKTFLERGEHVLPIVKATNARLRSDLAATNARLVEVQEALKASKESTDALERYHTADVKQKVEKARMELKAQLVAAKKAGDVESEVNLTDELTRLNTADISVEDTPGKPPNNRPAPVQKDYTKEPEFIAWKEDNPWFGTDRAKTAIAYDISASLRASGDTTVGRDFMDRVSLATAKEITRLGGGRVASKVEAPRGDGSGGNGKGKSYADLPAEAKAACAGFERDLVGPNRKYKTADEWHKSYAADYFREV